MSESTPNLRSLFEHAMALAPAERAAFLDACCPTADLRGKVERMLAADGNSDAHLLEQPLDQLFDRIAVNDGELPPLGTRIGPFALIERLGEGGSSIVFRAEREQAGVRQRVALKLLRRGLHSADEQRRFRDERRALAQLQHPGIARLIEGES